MDYQKILDQLATGELKEYRVEPKTAFAFQNALRNFSSRQNISGRAERGGIIIYTHINSDN